MELVPHSFQRSNGIVGLLTESTQDHNTVIATSRALSMASISSDVSGESPIVEQEEIAALTLDVRNFKESLGKLRRIFNADKDMLETLRVAAHERLGDVLRILRSVLEKYPALQASELLATAGKLIQLIKAYNYDDDKIEQKDLFDAIDQLALAFSSRVSEYLMGDLDGNMSFSSSLSSKAKQSCENLVSDADSVCEMQLEEKKPDLLSPREIDSLLLKLEQGVDFALHRAKLWAKYAKDVILYIEKRVRLDLEHASNLSKLAHTIRPMIKEEANLALQSIYCTALENDMSNSDSSQVTCSLLLGHKFLEPLTTRRSEHEHTRKKVKELWYRELTQMYDAISRIRKARNWYQHWQGEWEKRRDAFQRAMIDTQDQHKLEKKKQLEDETLQRALEAETSYKACVVDANVRHDQLLHVKTEVVQQIRELIIHSDHVFKAATVNYFQLQHTLSAPRVNQFQALCDSSQHYEPGSQYVEFVKQLPTSARQRDSAQSSPFTFEPSTAGANRVLQQERKSTDSIDSEDLFHGVKEKCGHHIGSDTDSISSSHSNRSHELALMENVKSLARKRVTVSTSGDELESMNENETLCSVNHETMSTASKTHTFNNLKTPSRCRECDSYVYFQGVDCSECGLSCHKKCLSTLAIQCGHKRLPRKMTTFGVDLGQHLAETTALVPHIICKCVDEIEKHGKSIKGIYRVSGVKSKVEKLCQAFENGANLVDLTGIHPNVIANVLKLYLRQLPEPLLTFKLYPEFVRIARESPSNCATELKSSTSHLEEAVKKLPRHHYLTLALLVQHLKRIADDSEVNHMPPSNLGIVFGPTLLRTSEGSASLSSLVDTVHQSRAIEMMISCAEELFSASEVAAARDYGAKWGKAESIAFGLYRSFSFMDRGKKAKEQPESDKIGVQDKIAQVAPAEMEYQVELAETEATKTQSGTSSDDELSYFLLTDNLDQLKMSHSSSMPKIFKGSLKDYQGLEGVSLTLLGSPPPEASDNSHPKLCASVSDGGPSSTRDYRPLREASASSETLAASRRLKVEKSDEWFEPTATHKPLGRAAGPLGKSKLHSHHTESSVESDYSFESHASSSADSRSPRELEEIPDVFLEPLSMYCKKTSSLNTVTWEKGKPRNESQMTKSMTYCSKGLTEGDKFKTEEFSMSSNCHTDDDPQTKSSMNSALTLSHARLNSPAVSTSTITGIGDYAAYIPIYQRHPQSEDTAQVISSKSTVTTEMHGLVRAQYVECLPNRATTSQTTSFQSSSCQVNQVTYKIIETGSECGIVEIPVESVAMSDSVRSQEVAVNISVDETPVESGHATIVPVLSSIVNATMETAFHDADGGGGEVLRSDKVYDYQTAVCADDEKSSHP